MTKTCFTIKKKGWNDKQNQIQSTNVLEKIFALRNLKVFLLCLNKILWLSDLVQVSGVVKKSQSPTVEIITNLELFLVFCWTGAYPVSAILFSTVSGSTWTKTNMPSVVLRDDKCLYCVQITFPCLRFCVIWRWQDRVEREFWLDTYLKCISVLLRRIGGGCELP